MSMDIEIDNVSMRFGDFTAVREASLTIPGGEFFSFLGPSGCGKTTILRMLSGFLDPSDGAIRIGGQDMRGIGPNKRPTALIFQNLALFPLMKVWENIAFGLEVRGMAKAERRKKADRLIELVALQGQGDKLVTELSGGQRQRVAIARALAVEPAVLLLDEPLSALDLKLRQHMRAELRAIQKRTGVTFIYITHDQGEALTMSDRIGVMSQGLIEQVGSGEAIYDEPATAFVATFVGENNPFYGRVMTTERGYAMVDTMFGPLRGRNSQRLITGDRAILFVRPERVRVLDEGEEAENVIASTIDRVDLEGAFRNIFVRGEGSRDIVVHMTNDGRNGHLSPGQRVRIGFDPDRALVLQETGLSQQ
ncbi:MAG: ATP-binding cassette domain-containing protein [Alphaproteobacteria bacterium]|jgi:spermidine/putrescine transport system ATP-binding protein|nr:ATP-binding cassette domain-containing protein [Alphaproteobacteria bacterium]